MREGGGSADGFGFKLFHEEVSHNEADGRTHGCTMHVSIILTLEEVIGIFRQNCSNVVMFCIDMEVLFCSCMSCCNFNLIM